eukprot:CAMPEP_0201128756 /NCGR_PEP_ID=MMETSP0850-20130426/34669_1 /ASSEMBLY_ACC=CAM_ASM_000622 /TAXON_ID=183588 /ORGANISM="Pseudo-nitzschia fraudulenta, Strain WWA7" /LENGTH=305 /DNA_ID=CAMNT_0047398033 /DNA_START=511 /DNA_END=1428 /DNA_ORIENTATION=+
MRTRLCNATDEEKLLEAVKCTAETESKSSSGNLETSSEVFQVEESTKYLRDRLKEAGDDELLNEDKKDDIEVKEDGFVQPIDKRKDVFEANEDGGEKSPSEDNLGKMSPGEDEQVGISPNDDKEVGISPSENQLGENWPSEYKQGFVDANTDGDKSPSGDMTDTIKRSKKEDGDELPSNENEDGVDKLHSENEKDMVEKVKKEEGDELLSKENEDGGDKSSTENEKGMVEVVKKDIAKLSEDGERSPSHNEKNTIIGVNTVDDDGLSCGKKDDIEGKKDDGQYLQSEGGNEMCILAGDNMHGIII